MSPDFMKRAISAGAGNVRSGSGGPFAALIVKEDRIIAEGTNRRHSYERIQRRTRSRAIAEPAAFSPIFNSAAAISIPRAILAPCASARFTGRARAIFYAATAADAGGAGFDDAFIYE